MTWGDKIRSMSDEGLMFFLTSRGFVPPGVQFIQPRALRQMETYEWLKSEVDDERSK